MKENIIKNRSGIIVWILIFCLVLSQSVSIVSSLAQELKLTPNVESKIETFKFVISFPDGDTAYMDAIKSVKINAKIQPEGSALWGQSGYKKDRNNKKLIFGYLKEKDLVTVEAEGYEPLKLEIIKADDLKKILIVKKLKSDSELPKLNVRIRGSFEAAVVGQKKYDAISAATGSATSNKNSDVIVEVAEGDNPIESDWTVMTPGNKLGIEPDASGSEVIMNKASGMEGRFSVHSGELSLAGEPAKEGKYPVKVKITDRKGRVAESNSLEFRVYKGDEVLKDQMKLENAVKTHDGKYIWDMEPWRMQFFREHQESSPTSLIVPKEMKAIFGSHSSGVYGELGYPSVNAPKQTLIIDKDTNLTLVNMKMYGSVNLLVRNGGKLSLHDSTVYGTITVEDGGIFSMNYDSHRSKFITGASIQGQIILKDGAILENASIYSNANHLSDGNIIKRVITPVIKTEGGNISIRGKVFIKGDDAPFSDTETNKYRGQPALEINGGEIKLEKDALLACFGGGIYTTNTNGGPAITLNEGKISGKGQLIAVGGNGYFKGNGGHGVEGKGEIYTEKTFAKGGEIFGGNGTSGAASIEKNIKCISAIKKLIEGKAKAIEEDSDYIYNWRDITQIPDLKNFDIEEAPNLPLPKPSEPFVPTPVPNIPEVAPNVNHPKPEPGLNPDKDGEIEQDLKKRPVIKTVKATKGGVVIILSKKSGAGSFVLLRSYKKNLKGKQIYKAIQKKVFKEKSKFKFIDRTAPKGKRIVYRVALLNKEEKSILKSVAKSVLNKNYRLSK